ncbi:hypothetical protein [Legionella waltersii]|uniref:Lipoprotein n=1 Tax=Legionella waltersii TaxID=66969 RepID=A0A0W1AN27_9GAMM|nr:hypothetical protein [Legionella waltersii]KTD82672.1 hypothetical protein Lwal_0492 [Legionella waltersii]SNU95526.1 Uncharacterised protein [Legionella waltersii]
MRILETFKMIIALVSSAILFTSCASSTTTGTSQNSSHTYEGRNSGGIGWH